MTVVELDRSLFGPAARDGAVGDRDLVCVQTLHIGRLTSDPVPIRPGSFVMVSGQGPTDSNNSGKTTFLATVSLLLADPQWRLAGPSVSGVAELLFDPAVDGVNTGYAADRGYVAGVFARDGGDPVTVWLRISRSSPYLVARWQDGVHLAPGVTDQERHLSAEEMWASMPRHTEVGAQKMAVALYGEQTRCLAYVTQRGSQHARPSLLQMNAGGLAPDEIADSLIDLVGRAGFFENDAEQRVTLDAHERDLAERAAANEKRLAAEDAELRAVAGRHRAREALAEARADWELHFARGLLEARGAQNAADAILAEAETANAGANHDAQRAVDDLRRIGDGSGLREEAEQDASVAARARSDWQGKVGEKAVADNAARDIERRLRDALDEADGWHGPQPEDCAAAVASAAGTERQAIAQAGAARAAADRAGDELEQLRRDGAQGIAAAAWRRLASAGIAARPLLDTEPQPFARAEWEARLAPWRDCLIVDGELGDAIEVLDGLPGAMVASARPGSLPAGVTSAPVGAEGLLAALADGSQAAGVGAIDERLGVAVVAGFDPPLAGRAARLAATERRAAEAAGEAQAADHEAQVAGQTLEAARDDLRRSGAAKLAAALREEAGRLRPAADQAAADEGELLALMNKADQKAARSQAAWETFAERLQTAQARAADAAAAADRSSATLSEAQDAVARAESKAGWWERAWGRGDDAARDACGDHTPTEKRLRNRASERLRDAREHLGITPDGEGAPTDELRNAVRRRSRLDEEEDGSKVEPAEFDDLVRPMTEHLERTEERDRTVEQLIAADRERRAAELETATSKCDEAREILARLQDSAEERVREALRRVSESFDQLRRGAGRHRGDLQVECERPQGPRDSWRWKVTPRWVRQPGGRPVPYRERANAAQLKLATVHLVLAALLAGADSSRGRVLILDELGDSLGHEHRDQVLRELARVAREAGLTVLGTCQDSLMLDGAGVCGQLLHFEYPGHGVPLNRATRVWAFDDNQQRVELTAGAVARPGW